MKKANANPSPLKPVDLRAEFLRNPLGLATRAPRLSWHYAAAKPGVSQAAWQIQCAATWQALAHEKDLIWDSGRVENDAQLDRAYPGRELQSREAVAWRVRAWDTKGAVSEWGTAGMFELGLLDKKDFTAQWIRNENAAQDAVPLFGKSFALPRNVRKARLYASARGVCRLWINGEDVGNDFFEPGWTDYNKRICVRAHDVKAMLKPGENKIGGAVAAGWHAGRLSVSSRGVYGKTMALWAQLEIELDDGSRMTVNSDGSWATSDDAPWRAADFYDGEMFDARKQDEYAWRPATVLDAPTAEVFHMRQAPPVREQMVLSAKKMWPPAPGAWAFDLGQNMVGVPRVILRDTTPGQRVTLRFAEMLNDDQTLYTANYRSAKSVDTYICKGAKEEVCQPCFTFHGFRHVEVSGLAAKPKLSDVTGVVLHSEMAMTGRFECSDALVNRLARNIEWGQRGNFLEVPTDCPQRDERLGWTGDAQVFVRTAAWNFDVAAFFEKWMLDMADSQGPKGEIPHVVPNCLGEGCWASAAWADAVVICPWTIWRCYDDVEIVRQSWDAMEKWMAFRERETDADGVSTIEGFGDWLAIDIADNNPGAASTPRRLISTAYHARCAALMEKMALALGRQKDAARYNSMAARVKAAFQKAFVETGAKDVVGRTQTAYLLALGFDLLPPELAEPIAQKLVANIEGRGDHLSTGFVGTPLLAPVLTKIGRTDLAYRLLFQETYPSWLYPILQGDATTMWERWNSYTKDKGFGDAAMNSFNHYAYGAIGEWMYNTVLGIDLDPVVNGYRDFIVRPEFCGRLTWAKGGIDTRYGRISIAWKRGKNGRVNVVLKVPPSCSAKVMANGGMRRLLGCGTHRFVMEG
ncbi:MAG: glycoside hydrolase family 78 protein [Kiritimatiellaeota bacterium]|nr:glycoside hydrolase family 78 protein [Kiritimatiellota bacterium]